jgi:outer membrane protein assembly factor BamB
MKALRTGLVLTLLAALAACVSSNLPSPNPLPVNPHRVKVHADWSVNVGSGGGDQLLGLAPDVGDGLIVAASAGGHVVAVNASNGHIAWQRHVKGRLSGGPAIAGGLIALGTRSGEVIALDAATGKMQWTRQVGAPVIVSPAIGNGEVVVNTLAGNLVALDAKTGIKQWAQANAAPSLSLRTATRPLLVDGVVYGGFADGKVMAVDMVTGKQLWLRRIAAGRGDNLVANMVDVGRQMVYAGGDLYVATYQGNLAAVVAGSGQVVWNRKVSSYTGVTLDAAHLYVSDAGGRIHAYDLVTGVPLWTYDKLGYRNLSAPVSYGSLVVAGDRFGFLHFLDRNTGHYLGRIKMGDGAVRMAPIVVGKQLIVLGAGGELVAYRVTARDK